MGVPSFNTFQSFILWQSILGTPFWAANIAFLNTPCLEPRASIREIFFNDLLLSALVFEPRRIFCVWF